MSKDLCRSEDLYLHKKLSECLFRLVSAFFSLFEEVKKREELKKEEESTNVSVITLSF